MKSEYQGMISPGRIVIDVVGMLYCMLETVPNPLEMVCTCIEIHRQYSKPVLISSWYRPPSSNIDLFHNFEIFI